MQFIVGLDLGQAQDYTALCVLEKKKQEDAPAAYECRHLHRFPLGTRYPAIVEQVQAMLHTPQLADRAALVVDASGVGRPVVDLFSQAGARPIAVTITGGTAATCNTGVWSVPKRVLVSTLQVLLQSERLKFAGGLPDTQNLVSELLAFQVTLTEAANDTYGGRTGTHDDLVLAVALAAWHGQNAFELAAAWA